MSYEKAVASRRRNHCYKETTGKEKMEIQRRIKLVEDAIEQLEMAAKVREQIKEVS